MKLITRIIEPKKVTVIWQAPENGSGYPIGKRLVVGEIRNEGGKTWLKYYNNQDTEEAVKQGFTGLTSYPYEPDKEFNGTLLDVLSKRVPPSSRTDYENYLRSYRISPHAEGISVLSLLAYTTGEIAGDGFTFLHSFEDAQPPFDFTIQIAGFRYNGLKVFSNPNVLQDKQVAFVLENSNPHDKDAVAITCEGQTLGYVPRGLTGVVRTLMARYKVSTSVERINGTLDRPNIFIFVEVR